MEAIKYKLPVKDTEGNTVEEKELVVLTNSRTVSQYYKNIEMMNKYAQYLGLPKHDGTFHSEKLEIEQGTEENYLIAYNSMKELIEKEKNLVCDKQKGVLVEDLIKTLITHFTDHECWVNRYEVIKSLKLALIWTKERVI